MTRAGSLFSSSRSLPACLQPLLARGCEPSRPAVQYWIPTPPCGKEPNEDKATDLGRAGSGAAWGGVYRLLANGPHAGPAAPPTCDDEGGSTYRRWSAAKALPPAPRLPATARCGAPGKALRWDDEGSSVRDVDAWPYISNGLSFTMTWSNARGGELFLGGGAGRIYYSHDAKR